MLEGVIRSDAVDSVSMEKLLYQADALTVGDALNNLIPLTARGWIYCNPRALMYEPQEVSR